MFNACLFLPGMGEPLNNYDEVLAALKCMTDAARFALAPSRVTVSTVGTWQRQCPVSPHLLRP